MEVAVQRNRRQEFKNVIIETIDEVSGPLLDVQAVINTLRKYHIINKEKCRMLTQLCSQYPSNKERLCVFACHLYETGTLEFLLNILDLSGLADISDALSQPVRRPIRRIDLPHSKHLQTFYFSLKQNIDSNTPFNRSDFLREQSVNIRNSFQRFTDDDDILKAASRFAVVSWLRIQHCNRNTRLIREVLNDMNMNWPNGIDDSLCKIFYHSKMAIAAIMDGDVTTAEGEIRIAKHLSASLHDPLTKALICHDSRYTNQRIYELQRSQIHHRAILSETETGLCFLESDSNGCDRFSRQMKRMFLLYVAQFKLNIHNDLNTREADALSEDEVSDASNAIDCFEQTLQSGEALDPRRGMIYMVCKAKIREKGGRYGNRYKKAAYLLSRAIDLAQEGAHYSNEARNIRDYLDRLIVREYYGVVPWDAQE